ncbi:MAG: hypothetical protein ACTSVK_07510 [Promethearchaeota archaeon]
MEKLNKNGLITKIPAKDCSLIFIEDDLTEHFLPIETIIEKKLSLEDLIDKKIGFCFINKPQKELIYWKYDPVENCYNVYSEKGFDDYFLHEKIRTEFNIMKVSGEKEDE